MEKFRNATELKDKTHMEIAGDLKDKVAIVTGGADGIGKAICEALLNSGCKVSFFDINAEQGDLTYKEMSSRHPEENLAFYLCDVTNKAQFKANFKDTIKRYGSVDILINNAGIVDETNWEETIKVNMIGMIEGCKLALKYMGKEHGGHGGAIINVSSNAGLMPFPLAPVYAATKHAMIGFTLSYGHPFHFEKTGVSVNAICPWPVTTKLLQNFSANTLDPEAADKHNSTLKDVMGPARVAECCVQLLTHHFRESGIVMAVTAESFQRIK